MKNFDFSTVPAKAPEYDLEQLLELGCHFGHQTKKWNPQMKQWIYAELNGVHIFDLAKTASQLQLAYNFAYQLGKEGKTLIFIGTKRQVRDVVKAAAVKAGAPYIIQRWLGGLLTNWDQVNKSLKRMMDIRHGLEAGKFDGYTKFERVQLDKEANRLARFFDGMTEMKKTPDAIFVVDPSREKVAVLEATVTDVPVLGIVDSNTDPRRVDLVIPANDDAVKSVEYLVNQVAEGYLAGKKAA
jgi:small subunit ribosomal protein S2